MNIDAKLEAARNSAVGYGKKRGAKEVADDKLKGVYAMLFEGAPKGTVAEMDSWVKRQEEYKEAVNDKAQAYSEWTAAEVYMKILFAEAEVWRTDQANNRMMDKAHR